MNDSKIDKNYEISYEGDLRVRMKHLKSDTTIYSDAPVDNHGKGAAFSPTDLLVSSLVSCILTIIGIHFQKKGRKLAVIQVDAQKVMYDKPRRVGEIHMRFDFGDNHFSDKELKRIRKIVKTCPVSHSIHPEIKMFTNLDN